VNSTLVVVAGEEADRVVAGLEGRVVPSPGSADAVRTSLASLVAGRWWPEPPDKWLRELPRVVPDQVGLLG
jgi:hypothetical protein